MNPTDSDWQTWAALAIVAVTIALFAVRWVRQKKGGCDSGCGCSNTITKNLHQSESD